VFLDEEVVQADTGQSPDVAVDGGNAVDPSEELQAEMSTATAEALPTIGMPVLDPDLLVL